MKKILVTGGSGKAGKATIKKLLEKNYKVFNVDIEPTSEFDVPFTRVDLENFGETVEAITQIDDRINGIDAIVHQARSEERRVGKECRSRLSPDH